MIKEERQFAIRFTRSGAGDGCEGVGCGAEYLYCKPGTVLTWESPSPDGSIGPKKRLDSLAWRLFNQNVVVVAYVPIMQLLTSHL